jgi:pimeloyl-ACP methyl ester carboxylesterase
MLYHLKQVYTMNTKNPYHNGLKVTLLFLLFNCFIPHIAFSQTVDDPGIWVRNYPTISKGLTSVIVKIRLTQPGQVYYAFYDHKIEGITASQIKSDAINQTNTSIQQAGTINYPSVPAAVSTTIDNFDREQEINLYLVAETTDGVMNEGDIKQVTFSMHFKHRIIPIDSTEAPYGFLEYLPAGYDSKAVDKYPLVLFFHGTGGIGGGHYKDLINPTTCMREGLTRYLEMDMDLPAVVISPQTPSTFTPSTVDQFIDFILSHYNVDPDRICVTGISMGGGSSWEYGVRHADRLSSLVPLCGNYICGDYSSLKDLPVWAFHNDLDPTVPANYTHQNIEGIIKAGGHPFMSIFPTDDHSCAYEAYYYPGLWNWVFAQRRGKGMIPAGVANVLATTHQLTVDGMPDEADWGNNWYNIPASLPVDSLSAARFGLEWNQNLLYAAVTLSKKTFLDNNKIISVYLNGNNSAKGGYDKYDYKLTFQSNGETILPEEIASDVQYKWSETDTSYNWEMAFPFSKTIYPSPVAGDGLGFDIAISSVAARDGNPLQLFWKGNQLDSVNTALLGDIILSGETNVALSVPEKINNPSGLQLMQNFPNPFSHNSTINYFIPESGHVSLILYNSYGHEIITVVDEVQNSGLHSIPIDGSTFEQGIYLLTLRYKNTPQSRKLVVIK